MDWDPEAIVPNPQEFIQFYIEGTTGNAFSQKDLDQYFQYKARKSKSEDYQYSY